MVIQRACTGRVPLPLCMQVAAKTLRRPVVGFLAGHVVEAIPVERPQDLVVAQPGTVSLAAALD